MKIAGTVAGRLRPPLGPANRIGRLRVHLVTNERQAAGPTRAALNYAALRRLVARLEVLRGVLWTGLRFRGLDFRAVLRFRGLEIFAGETSSGPFTWGASLTAAPLVGIILAAAAIAPKAIVAPNFG